MKEYKCMSCYWIWFANMTDDRPICPECGSMLIYKDEKVHMEI